MQAERLAAPDERVDAAQTFLLSHLRTIRAVVRTVNRRHRGTADDEHELLSDVFLHLMDNDYAVLRQFRGESSLRTYLHTVTTRVLLDRRVAAWGKWRPSARARALGGAAPQLERLLVRDHLGPQEAMNTLVHSPGWRMTEAEVRQLYADIRPRPRRRMVPLDAANAVALHDAGDPVIERDARRQTRRLAATLRRALEGLPPHEREAIRIRYGGGVSLAEVSRATGADQRRLYRSVTQALKRLRHALERERVSMDDVRQCVGNARTELDGVLSEPVYSA